MQSLNITWVNPDCFKTFRGISPPVTLLVEIFLITFSISPTGTPRRIHVDSTLVLRRFVEDQISTNILVISTYFFDVISLIEKSTSFPRTFFDVILLVEKSTLFPRTLFDVISLVEISTLFLPWSVSPCFYLYFSTFL